MSLLFTPKHIAAIRAGEKTATRRDWADGYHRPEPGDVRMAVTELFTADEECDCYIRVTDHYREPLGALDETDAQKEGGYTVSEFRDAWREINDKWDPALVIDVVEFEYLGRARPTADALVSGGNDA